MVDMLFGIPQSVIFVKGGMQYSLVVVCQRALVLNVRLWCILKFLVHFEGDGVDMCFFYFDVREKKSIFAIQYI